MKALCDVCLVVPSGNMQLIEDVHLSIAHCIFSIAHHQISRGALLNGQVGGFYNFVGFLSAFAMVPVTRRFGPKAVHAVCLLLAAAGTLARNHSDPGR